MDDWTGDSCLRRYRALLADAPGLHAGASPDEYQILTDDQSIRSTQKLVAAERAERGQTIDDLRVGVLANDPYVTVLREAVRFPDGTFGLYNRLLVPKAVVVLPMLGPDIVLMFRFRHGTRQWHYEIPRGIIERDESIENAIHRELLEELGAPLQGAPVSLGPLHSSSGITDEYSDLFLAQVGGLGSPDCHEAILRIRTVSPGEFRRLVGASEITDGPTLAAYARAVALGLLAGDP